MGKNQYSFIFDLDGTLYRFDKGKSRTFQSSRFHDDIKNDILKLIKLQHSYSINADEKYLLFKQTYGGDFSKAMMVEYKLPKKEYFNTIWNRDPRKYIRRNSKLAEELLQIRGRFVIATGAPKIWATAALDYLGVSNIVGNDLITCESRYRKPLPEFFNYALSILKTNPASAFSVGDDEITDILAAKSIGLRTVKIGKDHLSKADYQFDGFSGFFTSFKSKSFI